jgi:hypothetical protein
VRLRPIRAPARTPGVGRAALFGDTVKGRKLALTAEATGGDVLQIVKDGTVFATGRRTLRRTVTEPGRYGVRLVRGQFVDAVGTPIWFRRAAAGRVTTRACG